MTDTPRTWAELQTLFADNASGAISPQDLRDGFASVAQPIVGGGFPGAVPYQSVGWVSTSASVTLVANPTGYGDTGVAPFGSNRPNGIEARRGRDLLSPTYSLAGTDPNSAYAVDVDAGNAFMLEPGVWRANGFINVAGFDWPGTGIPPAVGYIDQVALDSTFSGPHDGSEPFIYAGFYNPVFADLAQVYAPLDTGQYRSVNYIQLLVNDRDTPQPFALYLFTTPGQTTNVTTDGYGAIFWKVQ